MTVVALLLLTLIPHDPVLHDTVDIVEINHVHDANGRLVLTQLIFWDWEDGQFQVVGWKMKGSIRPPERASGGFKTIWADKHRLRVVSSHSTRETWTQYDPEVAARKTLPKRARRGLKRSN